MPEHDKYDMDKQPVNCILEIPERDSLVVSAREDGIVCFWDFREIKVEHYFQSSATGSGVRSVCFSYDGRTLFTAHACGYVKVCIMRWLIGWAFCIYFPSPVSNYNRLEHVESSDN